MKTLGKNPLKLQSQERIPPFQNIAEIMLYTQGSIRRKYQFFYELTQPENRTPPFSKRKGFLRQKSEGSCIKFKLRLQISLRTYGASD